MIADSVAEARGLVGYLDFAEGADEPFWRPPASSQGALVDQGAPPAAPRVPGAGGQPHARARVPRGPPPLDPGRQLPLRPLRLPRRRRRGTSGSASSSTAGTSSRSSSRTRSGSRASRRSTASSSRSPGADGRVRLVRLQGGESEERRRAHVRAARRAARRASPGSGSSRCCSRRPTTSMSWPPCWSGRRTASSSTGEAGGEAGARRSRGRRGARDRRGGHRARAARAGRGRQRRRAAAAGLGRRRQRRDRVRPSRTSASPCVADLTVVANKALVDPDTRARPCRLHAVRADGPAPGRADRERLRPSASGTASRSRCLDAGVRAREPTAR